MAEEGSVVGIVPPPRSSDVLFGPGEDWQANACVNYRLFPSMNEPAYRTGFRLAAFQLAGEVCETAQRQDVLIYPIVYLYRHHVELALKTLIGITCELLCRDLLPKERKTLGYHDLAELWAVARPLLNPACQEVGNPPFPADDLEGIASYLRQLHEHDPDGQRFRYATFKGKAHVGSLRPDLKLINVRNFANAMERLADYLDNVIGWFDHMVEVRAAEAQESAGY